MNVVHARLDHKLRVNLDDLDPSTHLQIVEAMSIPNQQRIEAKKMQRWGWQQLDEFIHLHSYDKSTNEIVLPRGFYFDLDQGLLDAGYCLTLEEDKTVFDKINYDGYKIRPRPWQQYQLDAITTYGEGIIQAPAGSGKTVSILAWLSENPCKALIIVNTKDILWQWQERIDDFMGPQFVGQVGDNVFNVSPFITIATAQTLHRRFDQLEASGFFDEFSFVCLDECHHATADTYRKIVDRFSAMYRIGVSATPDKTGDFLLATYTLGPIIHVTKPEEVSTLIKPKVIKVPTNFTFNYRGNWSNLVTSLCEDPYRNALITACVAENKGHHQLVISKRLDHLDRLEVMLNFMGFSDPIIKLTGAESSHERQEAKWMAENEPCVLLSTLADEALDIPRLDRVHLTSPQKNAGLVTQQVGRVERIHPDKTDAVIYDYADTRCGILKNQWNVRRFEVYETRGYKIETRFRE